MLGLERLLQELKAHYYAPKTKDVKNLLSSLELDSKKVLILTSDYAPNIYKSATNVYNLSVKQDVTFSTYDILRANIVVVQESALKKINEVLG